MTNEYINVYRKTAELLRRDGWTQNVSSDAAGNHCLVGALGRVSEELGMGRRGPAVLFPPDAVFPLLKTLQEQWDWNGSPIMWNDMPGRTVEEVITLLEQTAEKLEADETIA